VGSTSHTQKDRERAVYGLKEKNLAKIYIKLIPLGMRDPDAIRLLNWKKPIEREVRRFLIRILVLSYLKERTFPYRKRLVTSMLSFTKSLASDPRSSKAHYLLRISMTF